MAKKSSGGPGISVPYTGGTGTGVTIPTGLDPTTTSKPKPPSGGPVIGVGGGAGAYRDPATSGGGGYSAPDYTGSIGQFGSYGPSTTNVFGAPGSSSTKIIYRDVMVNQDVQPNQVASAQSGTEAARMQDLAGSQSDAARQEVLKRMGNNMAGNASFDPRRPQTGGLFGVAFSKTTDSKTVF